MPRQRKITPEMEELKNELISLIDDLIKEELSPFVGHVENLVIAYDMGWELDEHIVAIRKSFPKFSIFDPWEGM